MTSAAHHPNDSDRLARPDDVERVLSRARALGWLALDTEFLRQDTYDPELCLVQIASDHEALLIEGLDAHPVHRPPKRPPVRTPQAAALERLLKHLAPDEYGAGHTPDDPEPTTSPASQRAARGLPPATAPAVDGPGMPRGPSADASDIPMLVVHSGVQDLEILRLIRPGLLALRTDSTTDPFAPARPAATAAGHLPARSTAAARWPFDTQIAASFLGGPFQASYQWLVEWRLGVRLDKTQSRTDWSQRPLTAAQRQYALDDVVYLAELAPGLIAELNERGRADMVREETERLYVQALTPEAPENLWRRIKGAQRLPSAALAVLREIAIWREAMAVRYNRPRRWIIADDIAVQLARDTLRPGFTLTLRSGRAGKWQPAEVDTLLAHIEAGRQRPPEEHPRWPARPVPFLHDHRGFERKVTTVHKKVVERFRQLGIASDWAGSAKGLLRWACDPDAHDSPWAGGWRQEVAGDLINPLRG